MIGNAQGRTAPSLPKRAVILSEDPTFWQRAGNGAYLSAFCRVLRSLNYEAHLIFVRRPSQTISRFEPDYLASLGDVRMRHTVRFGHRFVAAAPRPWGHALKRLLSRRDRQPPGAREAAPMPKLWFLPPLEPSLIDWARTQIRAIRPDLVVANYFNAAEVFEPDAAYRKAILVHDVFALRSQSYRNAGLPDDFDISHIERERQAFAKADLCIAITPGEAAYIQSAAPETQTLVLPHIIEAAPARRERRRPKHCLFVGSNNPPNVLGLAWLMDEVWPLVLASVPDASLALIGNLATPDRSAPERHIEAKGSVADLACEYGAAAVALVPPRVGSGLKVKLIEALAHGVPVVATQCGAEGVGVASEAFLRIHDNAKDYADAICTLMRAQDWQDRADAAMAFVGAHFSEPVARAALRDAVSAAPRRLSAD
jgi:succinoglycan biosynthesis protein ExoO